MDKLGKTLKGLRIRKGKKPKLVADQGGVINIKKQELYHKASVKVFYMISICIDLLNRDLIREFATVKEK